MVLMAAAGMSSPLSVQNKHESKAMNVQQTSGTITAA